MLQHSRSSKHPSHRRLSHKEAPLETEIAAALVGAAVGAGLGILGAYVVDLRKERRERVASAQRENDAFAREKSAIAALLLHDARRLESLIRQIFACPNPSGMVAGRPRLHYDGLMSHVRVFSIESLSAVHAFFRQVDHLFATLDGAREARGRGARIREVDEYHFRVLAGFTLQALPKAVEALRLEGGVIHDPADQWGEVTHPNLPEIGEPVFMEAKQRIAAYGHSGVAPGA